MSIKQYYRGMSESLRRGALAHCRRVSISYSPLWKENLATLPGPKVLPVSASRLPNEFADRLFAFDFCRIWLWHATLLTLYSVVAGRELHSVALNQRRTMLLICARLHTDCQAVRLLVLRGLDVQAKQIARSVSESLDALGRASLDTTFCDRFVKEQDVDESSKVWFEFVAKGRAKDFVYKAVKQAFEAEVMDEWIAHRKQEETVLAAASHPSYLSGFVSFLPHFGDEDDEASDRDVSRNSIRTFRYCSDRILEYMTVDLIVLRWLDHLAELVPNTLEAISTEDSKRIAVRFREVGASMAAHLSTYQPGTQQFQPGQGEA